MDFERIARLAEARPEDAEEMRTLILNFLEKLEEVSRHPLLSIAVAAGRDEQPPDNGCS